MIDIIGTYVHFIILFRLVFLILTKLGKVIQYFHSWLKKFKDQGKKSDCLKKGLYEKPGKVLSGTDGSSIENFYFSSKSRERKNKYFFIGL